mmetsp:Transcript_14856/g.56291  ORF Transcript_14856/g.56291 Transcript_14856/m.56291 type:complete len:206 (+) Transcript_14856:680-1297(+)
MYMPLSRSPRGWHHFTLASTGTSCTRRARAPRTKSYPSCVQLSAAPAAHASRCRWRSHGAELGRHGVRHDLAPFQGRGEDLLELEVVDAVQIDAWDEKVLVFGHVTDVAAKLRVPTVAARHALVVHGRGQVLVLRRRDGHERLRRACFLLGQRRNLERERQEPRQRTATRADSRRRGESGAAVLPEGCVRHCRTLAKPAWCPPIW